jgi:hypothetical protein
MVTITAIRAHLAATGATASETADALAPGAVGIERRRLMARCCQEARFQAKAAGTKTKMKPKTKTATATAAKASAAPAQPGKAVSVVDARIAELTQQIEQFDVISSQAVKAKQMNAATAARKQAGDCRAALAGIRAEQEIARTRDPVRRLELTQARAVQDGSWVAAATLGKQVEEMKAVVAAKKAKKAEESARDPALVRKAAVAGVKRMPDAMQEELLTDLLQALSPGVRERVIAPFRRGATLEAARDRAKA